MRLSQFRVLSEAEARYQRRAQVNACMAARSGQMDGKPFEKLMKGLTDGD